MKLKNKTAWNTKDLKRLINRTMKEVGVGNNRTIEVVYSKCNWVTGLATLTGRWVKMRVPKDESIEPAFYSTQFAKVLTHELHHNLGLQHKEMVDHQDIDCSWASEYKVGMKEPKVAVKEPLLVRRYNHAKQMAREKQEAVKRNQRMFEKWSNKVRYYEKKIRSELK